MRRVLVGSVAVPVAALLVGCGSTSRAPARAPVRLSLSGPADGTRLTAQSVLVRGTVSPEGATVLVAGTSVAVQPGGSFATRVALAPGQNIVDVLAGAPRARAAMEAVRVYRQVDVPVPSVVGETVPAARATLRARTLTARIVENEPFYSFLLPGSPVVCNTSPPAGRPVVPGSAVTVSISKAC